VPRRKVVTKTQAETGTFDRNQQFQQKLDLLLKTAAGCFNQKGFSGTSLRDVADRLNITDAALYYYVKNKEELVFLCYQRALDLGEQAMRRAAEEGKTGLDKLQLYIRYQMEAMCGSDGPVAILSEIPSLKLAHRTHILDRTRHDSKMVAAFVQAGRAIPLSPAPRSLALSTGCRSGTGSMAGTMPPSPPRSSCAC